MSDTMQYDFQMIIDGEKAFDVYRFGYDPAGFHGGMGGYDPSRFGGGFGPIHNSDSLQGTRFSLQVLCSVIEARKTMLLTKPSDLVTVGLVETYLQKKTLDHIWFAAIETANGTRTKSWVAMLNLRNVSIVNLWTRQPVSIPVLGEPILVDWVHLRASEAFEQNYDSQDYPIL